MSTEEITGEIQSFNIKDATDTKVPFDNPEADVILRSSDNVDFRVFRLLLCLASPFFKEMFSLPQPLGESPNETKDGLPIIQVSETSRILERLLLLCYPMVAAHIVMPSLETFEEVDMLLTATIKYNMEGVEKWVRSQLVSPSLLDLDPVRVFAVACRYRLREEAEIAAKHAARQSMIERPYGPELEYITGGQLYQLQQYQAQCQAAVNKVATSFEWINQSSFVWFKCGEAAGTMKIGSEDTNTMRIVQRSAWWVSYMEDVAKLLQKDASGARAQDTDVVDKALREASKCARCRKKAYVDIRVFGEMFGAKIEEVKSEVSLDFHF